MPYESNVRAIPALVAQLYQTVGALNKLFPKKPFTPDGHLVGSIGEVVAADTYDLILEQCSNPGFDAKTRDGKTVEIKLTGGKAVSVSSECAPPPDFLVVLALHKDKGFTEVYNGEFPVELWKAKKPNKRKVVSLSFTELKKLRRTRVLAEVHPLKELNRLFNPS